MADSIVLSLYVSIPDRVCGGTSPPISQRARAATSVPILRARVLRLDEALQLRAPLPEAGDLRSCRRQLRFGVGGRHEGQQPIDGAVEGVDLPGFDLLPG